MDLKALKEILNSESEPDSMEYQILNCLAKDEKIIPILMKMLDRERDIKKEISSEMNLLLSKADTGLDNPKFNSDNFMQKEIFEFYKKYKDVKGIGHCFKHLKF